MSDGDGSVPPGGGTVGGGGGGDSSGGWSSGGGAVLRGASLGAQRRRRAATASDNAFSVGAVLDADSARLLAVVHAARLVLGGAGWCCALVGLPVFLLRNVHLNVNLETAGGKVGKEAAGAVKDVGQGFVDVLDRWASGPQSWVKCVVHAFATTMRALRS